MSKLVIKFPTRNRPDKFFFTLQKYFRLLSGKHEVQFIITMDSDDETMNNPKIHKQFQHISDIIKSNNISWLSLNWFYGESKTKIEAVNANMENIEGDVLLVASDDMMPYESEYDSVIFNCFSQRFADFDGAIKFWDGLREKNDPLMTLCIMGFPLYKKFGYIYNPEYTSLYCDVEQTEVCIQLNKFSMNKECIISHQWTAQSWDELHARNENTEMYLKDKEVYERRKKNNFDIESMLSVDNTIKS